MPSLTLADGSEAAAVARAVAFVEAETAGLDRDLVDRVVLAAQEAVSNAVRHGRLPVELAWEPDDEWGGWLRVADAGPGPGRETIAEATLPDPAATGGRGLFLIRALADTVGSRPGRLDLRFVPRRTCA